MAGQKKPLHVGYIRVSTLDQNTERQLAGLQLDRLYEDKASGKDTKRPELERLLNDADLLGSLGATVHVHSMDRLARNLDDLRKVVRTFTDKGVSVSFTKESLTFTGEDNPMATLMLSVMGAFAEFERSLIKERQREGIAIAKQKGLYKGRKKALDDDQVSALRAKDEANQGKNRAALAREFGISRETLYQYLRQEPAAA